MKLHQKALNADQVKAKLKRLAASRNKERASYFGRIFIPVTDRTVLPGYKVRLNVFKGSNWSFDPETLFADSYDWWPMLKVIKGKLVRNRHNYSQSTSNHQWKVDGILEALGIKPDLTIHVRASLNNLDAVKAELLSRWAEFEVKNKYARIKRQRKTRWNYVDLESVKAIGIRFTKAEKAKALETAEWHRRERLDQAKDRKAERNQSQVRVNESYSYSMPEPTKRHLTLVKE